MKIISKEVFAPITITIESLEELKWMIALANTSVSQARSQCGNMDFSLGEHAHIQQLALWNGITEYRKLVS